MSIPSLLCFSYQVVSVRLWDWFYSFLNYCATVAERFRYVPSIWMTCSRRGPVSICWQTELFFRALRDTERLSSWSASVSVHDIPSVDTTQETIRFLPFSRDYRWQSILSDVSFFLLSVPQFLFFLDLRVFIHLQRSFPFLSDLILSLFRSSFVLIKRFSCGVSFRVQ